ncbi:MAG TPA: cytochrome c [Longimicrobiales bacterium]
MKRSIRLLAPLLALTAVHAAGQEPDRSEGRAVFEMVCAMCHSTQPPAKAAPPMSHAAAFYLRAHPDRASAAAAIIAYVTKPDAAASLLPPHAIERFGLMPAQSHLSPQQLEAVAAYVLTLADTAHAGARMRHGGPPHR